MKNDMIVIGCDDAAVDMKNQIIDLLKSKGISVQDVGVATSDDNTYYPLIAKRVCEEIIASGYSKDGILICGTGIGMAMTANKFKGIRAAVCHDNFSAERSRLSNDANVLCMGARVIGIELAKKVTSEWISLEYTEGRSSAKVKAIKDIDAANIG